MQWHIAAGHKAERSKVHLPVESFWLWGEEQTLVEAIKLLEAFEIRVEEALGNRACLKLTYEDDVQNDPAVGYRRICEFLGLSPMNVEPGMTRTNPFPLPELVENYDEMAEHLRGTPYQWMLEED